MTLFRSRSNANNSRKRVIRTCAEGEVVDISASKNPAIASKVLGEGFCVLCSSPEIRAPIAGNVTDISDKGHTYTISSPDGVCVLVCINADSRSEELEPLVEAGQVLSGDEVLCKKESAEAAVIVTNPEIMYKFRIGIGKTKTPEDGVIIYEL